MTIKATNWPDSDAIDAAVAVYCLTTAICKVDFLGDRARELFNAMIFEERETGSLDEWDEAARAVAVMFGGPRKPKEGEE